MRSADPYNMCPNEALHHVGGVLYGLGASAAGVGVFQDVCEWDGLLLLEEVDDLDHVEEKAEVWAIDALTTPSTADALALPACF